VVQEHHDERLIRAVLASGIRIPPMPEILLGLNALLNNPDAGPRELAGLIGRDGALSGAVFRLVGSPVFGLRARVDTVEKAITVLGLRSAAALVRGEALRGALQDPAHARALEALWAHSGAVADLALLALKTGHARGIPADAMFTLGMFHDCGLALLCKRFPAYAQALAQPGPWPDIAALDRDNQTHHAVIGQMVARNWLLAEDIVLAIHHHHDQAGADLPAAVSRMCAVLNFACHLHDRSADDAEWRTGWKAECGRRLGLTEGDMDDWRAAVEDLAA
jgi:HD-like signal output (HDOD) protein